MAGKWAGRRRAASTALAPSGRRGQFPGPIRLEMRVPRFRPQPFANRLFAAAFALSLAASAFAAPAAVAQIREGAYGVEGTNPDGTNYEGEFLLRTGPGGAWVGNWRVASENIMGLGLIQAGVLAVSFVVNGRPGVAVFEVEPDGRLRGSWTTGGGMGTEMLTPK
jgi:hypothetical protein